MLHVLSNQISSLNTWPSLYWYEQHAHIHTRNISPGLINVKTEAILSLTFPILSLFGRISFSVSIEKFGTLGQHPVGNRKVKDNRSLELGALSAECFIPKCWVHRSRKISSTNQSLRLMILHWVFTDISRHRTRCTRLWQVYMFQMSVSAFPSVLESSLQVQNSLRSLKTKRPQLPSRKSVAAISTRLLWWRTVTFAFSCVQCYYSALILFCVATSLAFGLTTFTSIEEIWLIEYGCSDPMPVPFKNNREYEILRQVWREKIVRGSRLGNDVPNQLALLTELEYGAQSATPPPKKFVVSDSELHPWS